MEAIPLRDEVPKRQDGESVEDIIQIDENVPSTSGLNNKTNTPTDNNESRLESAPINIHNSSTTYSKAKRFSRYSNAMNSAIPLRRTTANTKELPVDSIGCLSNTTFLWARKYRIKRPKKTNSLGPTRRSPEREEDSLEFLTVPYSDSSRVNANRLLRLYEVEENARGRINGSMLRVVWKFCKTRLIVANIARIISILLGIIGVAVLLRLALRSSNREGEYHLRKDALGSFLTIKDNATLVAAYHDYDRLISIELGTQIYYAVSFYVFIFGMFFLKSASKSVDLRTAIRLRTACIAASFSKSLESSLTNRISPHQVATLSSDEGDIIFNLILKGSNLISLSIGILICIIAGYFILGTLLIWIAFIVFLIIMLMVLGLMCIISSRVYHKSLWLSDKKLSIVEEYCTSFSTETYLNLHDSFGKRFAHNINLQYLALFRAELVRPAFAGGISILYGWLYFVWYYSSSEERADRILFSIMIVIFVNFIHHFIIELCDAFDAVLRGNVVLEKVKHIINLSPPSTLPTTITPNLRISISETKFEWDEPQSINEVMGSREAIPREFILNINELHVPKKQIIGVIGGLGSGKTSLINALLGHMKRRSGKCSLYGKLAYFPEYPYIIDGSVKENVIFYTEFGTMKYYNAISLANLNDDPLCTYPGNDDISLKDCDLTLLQKQKINIARAIFCESDTIILEEPFSAIYNEAELSELFQTISQKLIEMGKTILIVSENDSILRRCSKVHLLVDGRLQEAINYVDIQQQIPYQELCETYRIVKNSKREQIPDDNFGFHRQSHNVNSSTIELVSQEQQRRSLRVVHLFKYQIWYLTLIFTVNAFIFVSMPFGLFFFIRGFVIALGGTVLMFGLNFLAEFLIFSGACNTIKNLQRNMFDKLLNTSMATLTDSKLSECVNAFMNNNITAFQVSLTSIYYILIANFAIIAIIFTLQTWMCFLLVIFYAVTYITLHSFEPTIAYFGKHEETSRHSLFEVIASQLKGRAIIQSFVKTDMAQKKVYKAIEKNAAALFLRQSIVFLSQFLSNMGFCIGLVLLLTSFIFVESSLLGYFAFFLVSYYMERLIELRFDKIIADQRLAVAHTFQEARDEGQPDISTFSL